METVTSKMKLDIAQLIYLIKNNRLNGFSSSSKFVWKWDEQYGWSKDILIIKTLKYKITWAQFSAQKQYIFLPLIMICSFILRSVKN